MKEITLRQVKEYCKRRGLVVMDGMLYEKLTSHPMLTLKPGITVKEAREAKGLTRAELSRRFKIPLRTLEDWDAGKRRPPEWVKALIIEKLERDG